MSNLLIDPGPESTDYAQIAGYVQSFKDSSDRSRRTVFVITTICVLILIANWNLHPSSWARTRMRKAAELRASGRFPSMQVPGNAKPTKEQQLAAYNELVIANFPQEFVEQMLVVHIPAVGISTDVNEIGMLGGITLSLLMAVLLLSLMRQHENLYLATFKIRRLHERDESKNDGESTANFLYHSLAMCQVLTSPPTLARWTIRGRGRWVSAAGKLLFLIPAALQAYVLYTNWRSPLTTFYEVLDRQPKLLFQLVLLLILFILGVVCSIYVRAMDRRWRGAFFLINAGHHSTTLASWAVRVKLRSRWSAGEKALREDLEQALLAREGRVVSATPNSQSVTSRMEVHADLLTRKTVKMASHALMKAGRSEALAWCRSKHVPFQALTGFDLQPIEPGHRRAKITVVWSFATVDPT